MLAGEISTPVNVLSDGVIFNPIPGLQYVLHNFCLTALGLPSWHVMSSAAVMAVVAYIISFGDIVTGTEFLEDAKQYRPDEDVRVNPNLTNICCGVRNIIQSLFCPTVTLSGPLWVCCLILPLVALIRPILPLSMSLTLMIQAFGCFYVALGLCKNNTQRGVAGLIGGVLAITNPQTGLLVGIVISFICEWLLTRDFGGTKTEAAEAAGTTETTSEEA